jgi:hypothetical protein
MTIVNVTLSAPPVPFAFEIFNAATGEGCGRFWDEYYANKGAGLLMEQQPGIVFAVRPLPADAPFTLRFEKVGP